MKFKNVSLLLMCICAGLLSGCKSTPEKEAISQKQNIVEVVEKNKTKAGDKEIRSEVNAPESEQFDVKSKDGKTTINVNAKVSVPETKSIPAAKVINRDISKLDLKGLSDFFFDGKEYGNIIKYEDMSKSQLAELIENQKKEMEKEDYEGMSKEEKEILMKTSQDLLLELQGYYDKAPEKVEEKPVEFVLKEDKTGEMGENAKNFSVQSKKEGDQNIFSVSTGEYMNSVIYISNKGMGIFEGYFDGYENKCKYSEEEAKQKAEELLKKLGGTEEYKLVKCVPTVAKDDKTFESKDYYNGYQLSYKRVVNDVEEAYDSTPIMNKEAMSQDPENFSMASLPKQYESMQIMFSEEGLSTFMWNEPMTVDSILAENVKLISYEEAIKIFKDKVFLNSSLLSTDISEGKEPIETADTEPSSKEDSDLKMAGTEKQKADTENMKCKIDEIKLGLMRVKNQDSDGEYTLVPVWDFYGSYSYSEEGPNEPMSFLTINAMDGSIIDRGLGY